MSDNVYNTENLASNYNLFRPAYPQELFDNIVTYCQDEPSSGNDVAVDLGCGSGQSTLPLCSSFRNVIGIDCSEEQIKKATKSVDTVDFRIGNAEHLALPSSSVDLVTIGTALHWMDANKVVKEVERVLKPNGTVAFFCYQSMHLDDPKANDLFQDVFNVKLHEYWKKPPSEINHQLETLEMPFDRVRRIEDIAVQAYLSVTGLMGFCNTWSAFQNYTRKHPNSSLLKDFEENIESLYTDENNESRLIHVKLPLTVVMGRRFSK